MRVLHEKREKDDVVQNLSGLLPEVEGSVRVTVIVKRFLNLPRSPDGGRTGMNEF
jgi:hypothetical protein